MTTECASKFFLVVKKKSNASLVIDIFEHVDVEISDHFRVRCSVNSLGYRFSLCGSNPGKISKIDCDDRIAFSYCWYEEKYVFDNAFGLFEKSTELDFPHELLIWLANRI